MKRILSIAFFLCANYVFGQDTTETSKQKAITKEKIFTIVETMPAFPGGQDSLFAFLRRNIKYPKTAQRDSIQGKVSVNFVVDKVGIVRDVRLLKGVSPELDEEALRIIKIMPPWKPGTQNGKPVNVYFNIPINFILPKN